MTLAEYEERYSQDHQDPRNVFCHFIGIPLILISLGLVFFVPLLAIAMFTVGWVFQFIGHMFEGKKPSFTYDPLYLMIGPIFLFHKIRANLEFP